MGWSFRHSLKMGPLRLNLSTRGLGVSAGVRGARVGVGPRGTYVSFGYGGFHYRQKLSGPARAATRRGHALPPTPSPGPEREPTTTFDASGVIATASAADLAQRSPDEALRDSDLALRRVNWFKWYSVAALLFLLVSLPGASGAFVTLSALLLGGGALMIYRWNDERRTARIIYDIDEQELVDRAAIANAVGQWLQQNARLWHIHYSAATSDWKKNAGASHLIRRTPVSTRVGSLPRVETNIEPWCVPVGPQQLLFLPDRLLVWENHHLAGIPYDALRASASTTRFIEDGWVPPDSRQVDTTWRFVNKSGGPDRRFNNNRQLAVMEYGSLELESATGLRIILHTSSAAAADGAARALNELTRRARTAPGRPALPTQRRAPEAQRVAQPTATPSPPVSSDPLADRAVSVVTLLRYAAAADRRVALEEVEFASHIVRQLLPVEHPSARRVIDDFRSLPCDDAAVAAAVKRLRVEDKDFRAWAFGAAEALCKADGKATPKEAERLARIRGDLQV